MMKRTISSVVGVSLLIVVFWISTAYPLFLDLIIALAAILSVYEFLGVVGQRKKTFAAFVSYAYAFVLPFVPYAAQIIAPDRQLQYCVFITLIYGLSLFVYMVIRHKDIEYQQITSIFTFIVMISASLTMISNAYIIGNRITNIVGLYYVIIMMAAAWCADIGAYLAGTFFGKHKLIPEVSPKKTVEGFIGGIIFDIACLLLVGLIIKNISGLSVRYEYMALIGLAGSLISVIGDLTFSIVKRRHNVKDYGKIMPGHGGILDRIDSLIFTVPVVYVLILLLNPIFGQ